MEPERASAFGMNLSPSARTWVAVGSAALAFCYWSVSLGAHSTSGNPRVLFLAAMLFFGLMFFFSSFVWQVAGSRRTVLAKVRPNLILYAPLLLGGLLVIVGPAKAGLLTIVLAPLVALAASMRETMDCWRDWGSLEDL
jgi:hypothetical protein